MGNPAAAGLRATNPSISEKLQDVQIGGSLEVALETSKVDEIDEAIALLHQELANRCKSVWQQMAEVAGTPPEFQAGYSQQDIRLAVHEAGHAVVAWAVGSWVKKITMEPANGERSPVNDQNGRYGVPLAETHIIHPLSHKKGARSDTDIVAECAVLSAGPIAVAAYCHKDVFYGFMHGGGDDFAAMQIRASASEKPLDVLQGFAIETARVLCNKYRLLIYEIASMLLKKREISSESFLSTIAGHGLPLFGDPRWVMGVNPAFELAIEQLVADESADQSMFDAVYEHGRTEVVAKEIHNE
jgi:hypothetical protein